MFLYRATIYKEPYNVVGLTDEGRVQETIDVKDFEDNYKNTLTEIQDIILSDTTFVIEKDYAWIKGKNFANTKYLENYEEYKLVITSETELT